MPIDQIRDEIKSLEQVIYQDCFENFYHLILEEKTELLTSRLKKIGPPQATASKKAP
ncbi:MAG: hypothetical protein ACN6O7_22005 [Sphingobacterium sp.]